MIWLMGVGWSEASKVAPMAAAAIVAFGCGGGRTSLLGPGERAASVAEVRPCTGPCGEGKQRCTEEVCGPCQVPPVSRPCANDCGAGTETCRDGAWRSCTVPVVSEACASICGSGKRICEAGVWRKCDAPEPAAATLHATLRDFHDTHPDFERPGSGDLSELGLVMPMLGSDDTPTFARTGGTVTVTGPESFAQWFHDVPGINVTVPYEIPLSPSPGRPGYYEFLGLDFFPLDDDPRGFGNEGQNHDYHFTLATKFTFHYLGGELFRFTGDDDLWVFVNRHLAIDLGGLHQSKTGEVYLDDRAGEFGLVRGNSYELHLFFAERHMISSNFSIETTITDPGRCD